MTINKADLFAGVDSLLSPVEREAATLENEFIEAFYSICEAGGAVTAEDIRNMPTNVFTARLTSAGREVFGRNCEVLRASPYDRKTDTLISNNNALKQSLLSYLADFYIELSYLYNKVPSKYTFCKMLGISKSDLYNWSSLGKATPEGLDIVKKITEANEEALAGRLIDGKQNPVGTLAILNHVHHWNESEDAKPEPRVKTVRELAASVGVSLQSGQNADKSIRQIAQSPETP